MRFVRFVLETVSQNKRAPHKRSNYVRTIVYGNKKKKKNSYQVKMCIGL
jgi:hypothetical protein